MIATISAAEAIASLRRSMRLPAAATAGVSTELFAQLTRRAAAALAPCPRYILEAAVARPLRGLGLDDQTLSDLAESAVESLIAFGDLHETRVAADGEAGRFLVTPAWPTFVMRKDKSAILLGVAGDEITALPAEAAERVRYEGVLRILAAADVNAVGGLTDELGIQELSEDTWLRPPRTETSSAFLQRWTKPLLVAPHCGTIEELHVLEMPRRSDFYRDRWQDVAHRHDGVFVARRRQRYGDRVWCLVQLEKSVATRFIDLQSIADRERPCDIGWRLLMALDAEAGAPQWFRTRTTEEASHLDFFAPIPSWAERKLLVNGQRAPGDRALFTYQFDRSDAADERRFLTEKLWLVEIKNAGTSR